uniref:Uncharacterized protein n=1 Tax=Pyxicephalus adspersus TaxID=30357 RepID=A0AAV3AVV9_PYXAD|nr:TPA: hypothetical protein GDO54_011107 [Pyxicephalus adspersus]DBA26910.1 TPA: hypothetical protein GDO54_011107 [Pyxicephalus adspersus]
MSIIVKVTYSDISIVPVVMPVYLLPAISQTTLCTSVSGLLDHVLCLALSGTFAATFHSSCSQNRSGLRI